MEPPHPTQPPAKPAPAFTSVPSPSAYINKLFRTFWPAYLPSCDHPAQRLGSICLAFLHCTLWRGPDTDFLRRLRRGNFCWTALICGLFHWCCSRCGWVEEEGLRGGYGWWERLGVSHASIVAICRWLVVLFFALWLEGWKVCAPARLEVRKWDSIRALSSAAFKRLCILSHFYRPSTLTTATRK